MPLIYCRQKIELFLHNSDFRMSYPTGYISCFRDTKLANGVCTLELNPNTYIPHKCIKGVCVQEYYISILEIVVNVPGGLDKNMFVKNPNRSLYDILRQMDMENRVGRETAYISFGKTLNNLLGLFIESKDRQNQTIDFEHRAGISANSIVLVVEYYSEKYCMRENPQDDYKIYEGVSHVVALI